MWHVCDDIQLYASYNPSTPGDQVETARRLRDCIGEVRRWMAVPMLILNDEKTNMMIFTSKNHLKTYGGCTLTIGDDTVSPSHRVRNLYRLSSIRHYLTAEVAKNAINALVTNCNSLLHNIPGSQTARLQRVKNNAARLVTRTSKHEHVTPVFKELHYCQLRA